VFSTLCFRNLMPAVPYAPPICRLCDGSTPHTFSRTHQNWRQTLWSVSLRACPFVFTFALCVSCSLCLCLTHKKNIPLVVRYRVYLCHSHMSVLSGAPCDILFTRVSVSVLIHTTMRSGTDAPFTRLVAPSCAACARTRPSGLCILHFDLLCNQGCT
jgi:hypothetical protein